MPANGNLTGDIFNRKKKFGGIGISELRRLRQLEEENSHLKKLVADLSLDKQMLQEVLKKILRPRVKRELVMFLQDAFWVSLRRACQTLRLARLTWFYRAHGRDQTLISMRMKEIY